MLKQAQTRKTSDQVPCGICSFCSSFCIYHMHIYRSLTQYFCIVPYYLVSQSIQILIEQDILCALRNTSVFLPNFMTQLSSLHIWSINIERTKVDKWKAFTKQSFFFFFFPRKPSFQVLITIYRIHCFHRLWKNREFAINLHCASSTPCKWLPCF